MEALDPAGLGAGIVEFAGLADDDRSGAEDEDGVEPLGIVFQRWPEKYGGITFTQRAEDGSVIRESDGRFANDRTGKEMGLILTDRWVWDDLLRRHKGLSYGNL